MSVITTGNNPRLLQLGVNKIFGDEYNAHEEEYTHLFNTEKSEKAFEVDVQLEGFGPAERKLEGEGLKYDTQRQGFTPKYTMLTFAKGFIVTKENMRDNLYNLFPKRAKALARSMRQAKENEGANIYNLGFNPAALMTDGDGQPLFSTAHINGPSDPTTFSNTLAVAAPLSETAIEDLLIQIAEATDPRGLRIAIKGTTLIVPPKLGFEAQRITASVLQNDTANNALNAIKSMGMLPEGFVVNHYLTSDTAWFIKTNAPDGMKYFTRQAVEFGQDNDFGTSNARNKADERYQFGWTDPRGAYGTAGV